MATHSSILARRIPWTEEPGGLQSRGSQRAEHDWAQQLLPLQVKWHEVYLELSKEDALAQCWLAPVTAVWKWEEEQRPRWDSPRAFLLSTRLLIVLVHLDCSDRDTINWLAYKRYMFISHNSRGWEVQDHGTGQFSVPGKLPFWFRGGCLFSDGRCEGSLWNLFYESTNPIHEGSPYDLITFQRPNILTPSQ